MSTSAYTAYKELLSCFRAISNNRVHIIESKDFINCHGDDYCEVIYKYTGSYSEYVVILGGRVIMYVTNNIGCKFESKMFNSIYEARDYVKEICDNKMDVSFCGFEENAVMVEDDKYEEVDLDKEMGEFVNITPIKPKPIGRICDPETGKWIDVYERDERDEGSYIENLVRWFYGC